MMLGRSPRALFVSLVADISVGLDGLGKVLKEVQSLSAAGGMVLKEDHGPLRVPAQKGPHIGFGRHVPPFFLQDLHGGFIYVQDIVGQKLLLEQPNQRLAGLDDGHGPDSLR